MHIPSLLILFFLFTGFAFPYTVVTTSGKEIQGTLMSEEGSTILIKDSSGILISFKKEMLNLDAMDTLNRPPAKQMEHKQLPERRPRPTIAEIATQTRSRRKGTARSLTVEDLDGLAEVSVFGTDTTGDSSSKKIPEEKKSGTNWQSKILSIKKEVSRLRERRIAAESSCDEAKTKQYLARTTPNEKPSDLLSTYKESSQCKKLDEIETQLADAERRLDDLREQARRAGASWQEME